MAQSLCLSCGLCCDGTLFSQVPFASDEIAPMRALGFAVIQVRHPAYAIQPCAKWVGGSCTVYAMRPQNCRDFRCRLLQRYEAGEVSLEDALTLVRRALSLAATADQQRLLEDEFKPKRLIGDVI
jgi:hypothetical protein